MAKKDEILQQLKKHKSLSQLELELLNSIRGNNIRACISDLRKKGYDIKLEKVVTSKYVLYDKHPFISYLEKYHLFNHQVSIEKASKELGISRNNLKSVISNLFEKYGVTQLSSDIVIIKNRREE
jgi:biotin operon repressor